MLIYKPIKNCKDYNYIMLLFWSKYNAMYLILKYLYNLSEPYNTFNKIDLRNVLFIANELTIGKRN